MAMKYRTKLFIALSSLVMISTIMGLSISYYQTNHYLFNHLRSQLTSLVASAAVSIDGDELSKITNANDTKSPFYEQLIKQLRLIRNSNRRDDLYVNFVSIVKQVGPKTYIFIADAEEDPRLISHYGDPFIYIPEFDTHRNTPFCVQKIFKDEFGQWLAAFAPIKNDKGQIEGYLAVAQSASSVKKELHQIIFFQLTGLLVSLGLSFIVVSILASQFSKSLIKIFQGVKQISQGNFDIEINVNTKDELKQLSLAINKMVKSLKEKHRITQNFSRYVSQHVLDKILQSHSFTQIEGEKKKITVMFSDIKEFEQISESLAPENLVAFLNEYFENMIKIIFKYQGTLDKFIADGIMAEFGIPLEDPDQEYHAIKSAVEMQQLLKKLSEKWKGSAYESIHVGIGIHTGEAVVGNIGSLQRMEYTAIGDTVNTAARIESLTKETQNDILISKETYLAARSNTDLEFESLGPTSLRGKKEPLEIFAVKVK